MNEATQKKQICRFLKGRIKKDVDTFCIYQWIERCHYQGWWDLGNSLGSHMPPNSLDVHYQKRLEYILSECRKNLKEQFAEVKMHGTSAGHLLPKSFLNTCSSLGISLGGKSKARIRLEYLGKKIVFLEKINSEGCIFYFTDIDKEKLIHRNRLKDTSERCRIRKKMSWDDAHDIIKKIHHEVKPSALMNAVLKGLTKTNFVSWEKCLTYLEEKYKLNSADPSIDETRQLIIRYFSSEGHDDLAKRLSSD